MNLKKIFAPHSYRKEQREKQEKKLLAKKQKELERKKFLASKCVCELISLGEISGGWCHIHKTSWV